MTKRTAAFFLATILLYESAQSQDRSLVSGMTITKTCRIKKGIYQLPATGSIEKPIIVIRGNNIVVDFNNAELKGSKKLKQPDTFTGVAVLIEGKNVTIKNLKANGYKIALMARSVEGIVIENSDLSYNYRPRLNSSQEKEDISDWMSYHQNEKDEWLRYGAAIYLKQCNNAIVRNCKVTGGQNALLLNSCNDGSYYNNDFSFNSGIGIGMYRSSRNKIMHNRMVFNVRGYSHGVYNRGQDSAGILVYEQSNNNLFYRNNVTHGGDGFFLWAGQTTMDTGAGGCNDNIILENDFSYAPTNGIEVTFSRNRIERNRMFECDHGIWGGYSYETLIAHNQFRNNRVAIAIEHGLNNKIYNNLFIKDKEAIRLWAREKQPSDWGYAKYRDTRSAAYAIVANSFNDNNIVYNLDRSDSIYFFNNSYSATSGTIYKTTASVSNLDTIFNPFWDEYFGELKPVDPPVITNPRDPFKGSGIYNGRKNIRMTEWGPYDFGYPIIWNTNPTDSGDIMEFDLIGPKGKWAIKKIKGVEQVSINTGTFPSKLTARKIKATKTDIAIEVEYKGPAFVNEFGEKITANKPYIFSFRKFFQPLDWEVLFFSMDTLYYNPLREQGLFSPTAKMAPVKTEKVSKLDYAWWGGLKAGETYKQFITVAATTTTMPPGNYILSVTWDDAVRIYLDDKLILDEWSPSKYSFDTSPHKKIPVTITRNHNLRVEHLELGGFATLAVKILKP